jgi:hypothetical protein
MIKHCHGCGIGYTVTFEEQEFCTTSCPPVDEFYIPPHRDGEGLRDPSK